MTKKTKLEGKVALVTGSAQGLGEAILKEFVYEGASTILLDLNRKEANKVKREIATAVQTWIKDNGVLQQKTKSPTQHSPSP